MEKQKALQIIVDYFNSYKDKPKVVVKDFEVLSINITEGAFQAIVHCYHKGDTLFRVNHVNGRADYIEVFKYQKTIDVLEV